MKAVDEHLPVPTRDKEEPFMLPIEHVYSIPGRGKCIITVDGPLTVFFALGTVVSGRCERGKIKIGEDIDVSTTFLIHCRGLGVFVLRSWA